MPFRKLQFFWTHRYRGLETGPVMSSGRRVSRSAPFADSKNSRRSIISIHFCWSMISGGLMTVASMNEPFSLRKSAILNSLELWTTVVKGCQDRKVTRRPAGDNHSKKHMVPGRLDGVVSSTAWNDESARTQTQGRKLSAHASWSSGFPSAFGIGIVQEGHLTLRFSFWPCK